MLIFNVIISSPCHHRYHSSHMYLCVRIQTFIYLLLLCLKKKYIYIRNYLQNHTNHPIYCALKCDYLSVKITSTQTVESTKSKYMFVFYFLINGFEFCFTLYLSAGSESIKRKCRRTKETEL